MNDPSAFFVAKNNYADHELGNSSALFVWWVLSISVFCQETKFRLNWSITIPFFIIVNANVGLPDYGLCFVFSAAWTV